MTEHHDIEELLGAYVCDAVDADERQLVERHLPECPRCRAEVAELREVTALLANADAAASVPEGVWDRISSSLEETPPPLRLHVMPPSPAPRWRGRRFATVAVAAAAVVGILSFAIGRTTGGSGPARYGLQAAVSQALAAPGSRRAMLVDDAQVQHAVAVVQADGRGYLIGGDLPALRDRVYQLWAATTDGAVVSLGVLPQPGVIAFSVGDPSDVTTLMLTEETRPVDHPSTRPVVQGPLA